MDVGATLRSARERRNLSIEELAKITKINPVSLRSIECNQFATLPGGIFVRGFLRAYAKEVGVDPDEVVREYLAQYEAPVPEPVPERRERTAPTPVLVAADADTAAIPPRQLMPGWPLAVLILAILFGAFYARRGGAPDAEAVRASSPPPAAAPAPAQPAVATTGMRDDAPPLRDGIMRFEIAPGGPCWISVTADGATMLRRLMQPGERQTIEARNELVIRVGDPASCTYRINGQPGRQLGVAGAPVTVQITPQNHSQFAG